MFTRVKRFVPSIDLHSLLFFGVIFLYRPLLSNAGARIRVWKSVAPSTTSVAAAYIQFFGGISVS